MNQPPLMAPDEIVVIRLMCHDGQLFELPVANRDVDIGALMVQARNLGFISTPKWFVPFESILWAVMTLYTAENAPPHLRKTPPDLRVV